MILRKYIWQHLGFLESGILNLCVGRVDDEWVAVSFVSVIVEKLLFYS